MLRGDPEDYRRICANAACKGMDAIYWYSLDQEVLQKGKAICDTCSVKNQCYRYALETNEPFGTWGGVYETDRAANRKYRYRWSRVLSFLEEMNKPMTVQAIIKHGLDMDASLVQRDLSRLVQHGVIVQEGNRYRLAS
jgi:WhiB family redox-sensing transcriptional regulator